MKTSLDHLPAFKQRDLERVLQPGVYEDMAEGAQARRDHQLRLASSAAHLSELASAERRANVNAVGVGGWKSQSMVRRNPHKSVKHLRGYGDRLTFQVTLENFRQTGRARKAINMVTVAAVRSSGRRPNWMSVIERWWTH